MTHRYAPLLLAGLLLASSALAADPRITLLEVGDNAKDGVSPHWTITADQAEEALAALLNHLQTVESEPGLSDFRRSNHLHVRKQFAEYRFQAYGITMGPRNVPALKGPTRVVELNGHCDPKRYRAPAWSERPLLILDGGPCYFRAFYDVTAKRIIWVSV